MSVRVSEREKAFFIRGSKYYESCLHINLDVLQI